MGQIQDFVLVFKRRKWQVILPALFVLAGGVVFAVIVPKKYRVTTSVELLQPTMHVGQAEESATLREIRNAQYHLRNSTRVEEAIVAGNWDEYARLDEDERLDFVMDTRSAIGVKILTPQEKNSPMSSVFVEISYADVDGKRAERFLSTLTGSWIDEVVQRDYNQLQSERDEYQNQVTAAQKHFDSITKRKTDLWAEMGISVTQADMRNNKEEDPVFVELTLARQERDLASAELEQLRAKLSSLRKEFEAMPTQVEKKEVDPGLDLGQKIAQLELKKAGLEQVFEGRTPENTKYKIAQRELETVDKEIATLQSLQREETMRTVWIENPERKAKGAEIAVLELEEVGLKARLDKWNKEVDAKTSHHQAQIASWDELIRLNTSAKHASDELDEAMARLRAVGSRIAAYNAVQGEPYRIADPPRAPAKPTEPNPIIIVVVSLLGGIAFGLGVAFLSEFSRSCYRSVGDLSRSLGVPILGVVNRIYTRSERRANRSRRLIIGASAAIIMACVGWFTYAWVYDQSKLTTEIVQVVEDLQLKLR